MKTKLVLRDRINDRPQIYGTSVDNMIRRMFGRNAGSASGIAMSEPFTVVATGGRVLGSAIFHEA